MKFIKVILFLLVTAVAVSSFSKKKMSEKDYRNLAKKAAECIKSEDRKCLVNLTASSIDLKVGEHNWGCKGSKLTGEEYVDCILASKVFYDEDIKKTLKDALLECFASKGVEVLIQYRQFYSSSGLICYVIEEKGELKISDAMMGD